MVFNGTHVQPSFQPFLIHRTKQPLWSSMRSSYVADSFMNIKTLTVYLIIASFSGGSSKLHQINISESGRVEFVGRQRGCRCWRQQTAIDRVCVGGWLLSGWFGNKRFINTRHKQEREEEHATDAPGDASETETDASWAFVSSDEEDVECLWHGVLSKHRV